jgi:hypothetical protein
MSADLRLNVIAIDLGKTIYYASLEAFDGPAVPWEVLAPETKGIYVEKAGHVLRSLDPSSPLAPAAVTRPHLGPDEAPSTLETSAGMASPGRLFDFVAAVARTEAARVLAFRGLDDSDGRD